VNGRQGTFVSQTPPHLNNYALVFPTAPEGDWNRFFGALNHEAAGLAQAMGRQLSVYYGADSHSNHADYERLLADIKAHRLGGIMFATRPDLLQGTPVLDEPKIPRVAIMGPSKQYAMPQINLNRETLWERGAQALLAQGRRNLALLLTPVQTAEIEAVQKKMLDLGFNVPPQWVQGTPRQSPVFTRNLTHLLFENGRNRPDAFFITDDNLIEPALAGLMDAGVRVPEDVEVIAHCNFPHAVPAAVPVRRLGFDARHVLQAGFDALNDQRAGRQVPSLITIPAQFEEEIDAGL
jgi:DNA-binding LacI/PurR family transcriptional regulator